MRRVFADSNVFLRLLTEDDRNHHRRAVRLFEDAEAGRVRLVAGPPVIFEVAWTLRSAYKVSREDVLEVIGRLLATPGLELTDRSLVVEALRRARDSGQEFADAYIAASVEAADCDAIATFNRQHFKKLGVEIYRF